MIVRKKAQFLILITIILSVYTSYLLKPTQLMADQRRNVSLEIMIPKEFGDWKNVELNQLQIVNPQQVNTINRIYSDTLSRTYINSKHQVIMLTLAYGRNQNDNTQLHYPEVCYPAQGFGIQSIVLDNFDTEYKKFAVKKMVATNKLRIEPITYWTTIGDVVAFGGLDTKKVKLRYAFRGLIPDGMLVRVSNIATSEQEVPSAFDIQKVFISDLINGVSNDARQRLIGN